MAVGADDLAFGDLFQDCTPPEPAVYHIGDVANLGIGPVVELQDHWVRLSAIFAGFPDQELIEPAAKRLPPVPLIGFFPLEGLGRPLLVVNTVVLVGALSATPLSAVTSPFALTKLGQGLWNFAATARFDHALEHILKFQVVQVAEAGIEPAWPGL